MAIQGTVRGGQQAIQNANVYLLAANAGVFTPNASGYGNASVSLLKSVPGQTFKDTSGGATNGFYYASTDSGGNFSISNDYTCTANQQVYIYVLGGNAGSGTNTSAGLMVVLGSCPTGVGGGTFATQTPYVVVNEVTTVAAAYAFAGFATDATDVSSSGTPLALTGIANAFANAGNLANITTGTALATTPAGNGAVPQSEINTLANVLASCVNTAGGGSPTNVTPCYQLLNNAQSNGSSGTVPGDTATAAINIAHNPGANISPLYALSIPTPPFAPALSRQPNDFTIQLTFSGGGTAGETAGENGVSPIAIDGAGNVWLAGNPPGPTGTGDIIKLSPLGAAISPSTGYTGGVGDPTGIAIDNAIPENVWVANSSPTSVSKLSEAGAVESGSGYTGGGIAAGYAYLIAIDGQSNVWVANNQSTVSKLSSSGTPISTSAGYTGGGQGEPPGGIAIDGSGNAWISNAEGGPSDVAELSSSGTALSTANGYIGGGVYNGIDGGIALDSSGRAWIADTTYPGFPPTGTENVAELNNSGGAISGANGYVLGGSQTPLWTAIDGAGNVWVAAGPAVAELSSAGTILSPASTGYTVAAGDVAEIAIDGSGNAWTAVQTGSYPNFGLSAVELVGVATPVVTPICAGLPSTPTLNGTSSLGTRP
jgi:hypothetical protein